MTKEIQQKDIQLDRMHHFGWRIAHTGYDEFSWVKYNSLGNITAVEGDEMWHQDLAAARGGE